MIALNREYPKKLLVLESLLSRMRPDDPDYLKYKQMYMNIKKGYEGELRVDREWKEINIQSNHFLFHNYQSINEYNFSHQIDTLFLSTHFVLLLEIKNISGSIEFDQDKHQFIRTNLDGSKDSFYNPIDQIERHKSLMNSIMNKITIRLPIETAIIIANPSTIINQKPENYLIFHVSGLRTKMRELFIKYENPVISNRELELFKTYLLSLHRNEDSLPTYNRDNLIKGALCTSCTTLVPMKYTRGYFKCVECNSISKDEFLKGLHDYRLLYEQWITNGELREFFGIESIYAANKLLKSLNLVSAGINRGKKYFIPEEILKLKFAKSK